MNGPALIVGASGQDGCYLARHLLAEGYETHGTTRGDPAVALAKLGQLSPNRDARFHSIDPADADAIAELIAKLRPSRIFYLAAQSSVWRSFLDPQATFQSSVMGLYSVLQAVQQSAPSARLVYAASGDCFGANSRSQPATETSPFAPRSPYAVAKCAGALAIEVARRAHGLFVCSAFLFSHESPLRGDDFVTAKIAGAARRIAGGSREILSLDTVSVTRDWGWAPDYVVALDRMLDLDGPEDLIIATGESRPLQEFVAAMFNAAGLDWRDHVRVGDEPGRPTDILQQYADPAKARALLDWRPTIGFEEMARRLVKQELTVSG